MVVVEPVLEMVVLEVLHLLYLRAHLVVVVAVELIVLCPQLEVVDLAVVEPVQKDPQVMELQELQTLAVVAVEVVILERQQVEQVVLVEP
jgi:hypothetical protein